MPYYRRGSWHVFVPPTANKVEANPRIEPQDAAEPFYSEEELDEFYQNLLLSEFQPTQAQGTARISGLSSTNLLLPGPSNDTIKRLEKRFRDVPDLTPQMRLDASPMQNPTTVPYQSPSHPCEAAEPEAQLPHLPLLHRLNRLIENAETSYRKSFPGVDVVASSSGSPHQPKKPPIPLALISSKEWFDLVRHCMDLGDANSAQQCLSLMKRSAQRPPAGYYGFVLKVLAEDARIREVEEFMAFMKNEMVAVTEDAVHQHAKAYVRSRRLSDACSVIHSYEESHVKLQKTADNPVPACLPSQKTYTLVVSSLLAQNQAHSRALAWDLFAHMRYVAHPIPDAPLYATMLRACAYGPEPHAERALDLWTEMRIDNKIPPTRDAYNALILACARASGRDKLQLSHAHDAFRFAREMLDAYRAGADHLKPNAETFTALLESAKRTGDLARARWILAELAGSYAADPHRATELAPNQDAMSHIFQVYAAYQPLFPRRRIGGSKASDPPEVERSIGDAAAESDGGSTSAVARTQGGSVMDVPQSRGEVVAEASALFQRIIASAQLSEPSAFSRVKLTTHLLNSYLSVHLAHSPLAKSRNVYDEIFSNPSNLPGTNPPAQRNARTFLLALQRCVHSASPASGRSAATEALSFARAVWDEWITIGVSTNADVSPRTVEKIWSSMIRVLALSGNIDDAMVLLRDFACRYPPDALTGAASSLRYETRTPHKDCVKYETRARTHLVHPQLKLQNLLPASVVVSQPTATVFPISASPAEAQSQSQPFQPLIQVVSPTLVADPHIPPWLSFADVGILHQRLLALERWKDVGYLTWLTRAYAGSMRKRREASLAGLGGPKRETNTR